MLFGLRFLQGPALGVVAAMLWVETGLAAYYLSPSVLWERMKVETPSTHRQKAIPSGVNIWPWSTALGPMHKALLLGPSHAPAAGVVPRPLKCAVLLDQELAQRKGSFIQLLLYSQI